MRCAFALLAGCSIIRVVFFEKLSGIGFRGGETLQDVHPVGNSRRDEKAFEINLLKV